MVRPFTAVMATSTVSVTISSADVAPPRPRTPTSDELARRELPRRARRAIGTWPLPATDRAS